MRLGWVGASANNSLFSLAGLDSDIHALYSFSNLAIPTSFVMSPDGTTQIVLGDNTEIRAYSTTTDYYMNGTTNTSTGTLSFSATHIFISPDGTKLYTSTWQDGMLYEYTMGTPWTPSTLSYTGRSFDTSEFGGDGGVNTEASSGSVYINDDGTKLVTFDTGNRNFVVYDLGGPAWQLSSVTHSSSTPASPAYLDGADYIDVVDWCFDPSGRSIVFAGSANGSGGFKRINVLNAFDVEAGMAGSAEGQVAIQTEAQSAISIFIADNTERMYFMDGGNDKGSYVNLTEDTFYTTGHIAFRSSDYSNIDNNGGVAWVSPWNAQTPNGNNATASMTPGQHSDIMQWRYLLLSMQNLPDTAIVTGMRVYIKGSHSGDHSNITVRPVGLTTAGTRTIQLDSFGWRDTGGDGIMWGNATITKAQLESTNFGLQIYQSANADFLGNYYAVDAWNIEIFYTMP